MNILKLLYIDPGTGGMLFTVLFGIFGVIVFSLRALLVKMKFAVGRDKNAKVSSQKIPLAIFAETKRYWSIFKPLCDEMEKRGEEVLYLKAEALSIWSPRYPLLHRLSIGSREDLVTALPCFTADLLINSAMNNGTISGPEKLK